MIPIKKPNISTNRYKELLRIEKYCDKLQKEYFNYIETSRNQVEELCNEIGELEEKIDKAIERLQDYDIVEDKEKVIDDTFDILRGSDK